jgi:hypothetical protein
MKSFRILLPFVFFLLSFSSCGEPTMDQDAQKAAGFSNESNRYAMDNDITNAGRTYTEAQAIINKYKRMGKFDEFYKLYNGYLEMGAYDQLEAETSTEEDASTSN